MSLLLQTLKQDRPGHETGALPRPSTAQSPTGLVPEFGSATAESRVEPVISSPRSSAQKTTPEQESARLPASSGNRLRRGLLLGGGILAIGIAGGFVWQQLNGVTPSAAASMPPHTRVASSAHTHIPIAASQSAPEAPRLKPASTPPATARIPQDFPHQTAETTVPPQLENAWSAFQQGDLVTAEKHYRLMYSRDPYNRDVLLGLAAIALRKNRQTEALGHYQRVLALDPEDREAQSGLLLLEPDGGHETALQERKTVTPAPAVLAQLHAANRRWPEAQELYFQAYRREPDNPDLAFNLAISLDHMHQPELAALYYRKALTAGTGQFDRIAARKRLAEITAGEK